MAQLGLNGKVPPRKGKPGSTSLKAQQKHLQGDKYMLDDSFDELLKRRPNGTFSKSSRIVTNSGTSEDKCKPATGSKVEVNNGPDRNNHFNHDPDIFSDGPGGRDWKTAKNNKVPSKTPSIDTKYEGSSSAISSPLSLSRLKIWQQGTTTAGFNTKTLFGVAREHAAGCHPVLIDLLSDSKVESISKTKPGSPMEYFGFNSRTESSSPYFKRYKVYGGQPEREVTDKNILLPELKQPLVDSRNTSSDFRLKKPFASVTTLPVRISTATVDSQTTFSDHRSFMATLSGPSKDPNRKAHPEASIYVEKYANMKEDLHVRLFEIFNREVFGNRLPSDLVIEWSNRMSSSAGLCKCEYGKSKGTSTSRPRTAMIVLSHKINTSAERLRDTLIHELCHAAVWILDESTDNHGPIWRAWAQKANETLPELPEITTCHSYDVDKKYTYKCTKCGYSFKRNIRRYNVKNIACGRCGGIFEIVVNALQK